MTPDPGPARKSLGEAPSIHPTARLRDCSFGHYCEVGERTVVADTRSSTYDLGEDDAGFFDWRRDDHVTLGHDVWLGHGAIVLAGVTIGNGAAIGAGAIVTKDVPPFAIVVGNPARLLRYRFPPDIIAALERIAWWHWPHPRLRAALADIRRLPAADFCARHEPR